MAGLDGLLGSLGTAFQNMDRNNPEALDSLTLGLLGALTPEGRAFAQSAERRSQRLGQERQLAQQASQFDRNFAQEDQQFSANQSLQRDQMAQARAQFAQTFGLQQDQFSLLSGKAAQEREDRNKTREWAQSTGDPNVIGLVNAGQFSEAFKLYAAKNGGGGKYGLNPVYGTDASGKTVIGQLGEDGSIVESRRPEGFTPLSPYELQFGKARGGAEGKAIGEDTAGYDTAESTAQQVSNQVQSLIDDPDLDRVLGWFDANTPNFTGGANRVQGKIDQLQGGAFLQARQFLKGQGQITDFESKRAEAATVRMNQAQTKEDFVAGLKEFNKAVQDGFAKLGTRTGKASDAPAGNTSGTSGNIGWKVK